MTDTRSLILDTAARLFAEQGYVAISMRHIDPDENFATMLHGSSSCGEDRLGHSEQPSKTQCRASHLGSADIRSYDERRHGDE